MRKYRASEADRAMLCPASVNAPPDEILIRTSSRAGLVGTVVHKAMESIVHGGHYNLEGLCHAYGLTTEEGKDVARLSWAGKNYWDANSGAFPRPMVEWELKSLLNDEEVSVSGHIDVANHEFESASIIDWKTTRLEVDYSAQMLFYAWLIVLYDPNVKQVTTSTVFLRDQTADVKVWTEDQIHGFGKRYIEQVIDWDGRTYNPGGQCSYCPRFVTCPARAALVQKTISELGQEGQGDLLSLYKRLQVVDGMIKKAKDQIRAEVDQAGGELDGLQLVPAKKDTIHAKRAWPVLTARMESDEFASAVTINKGDIMEIVASMAPRGKKKEAKDQLMEDLRAVGAITTTEYKMLRTTYKNAMKELTNGSD